MEQLNPIALRKAKVVHNFGLSECNRVKVNGCTVRGSNCVIFMLDSLLTQWGQLSKERICSSRRKEFAPVGANSSHFH